jgi:hypothetical protein
VSEIPAEVLAKAKPGHVLENDPPAAMTAAQRWTCKTCGDAVLRYESIVYGGATERTCDESQEFWKVTW